MLETQICVYDFPMRIRIYETDEDRLFTSWVGFIGPRKIRQSVQDWRLGRRMSNPQSEVDRYWLATHFRSDER